MVDRIIGLRVAWSDDPTGLPRIRPSAGFLARFAVVGPAITTLGWRVPGVLRVPQLALRQVVESFLLGAEDLELVLAFVGLELGSVGQRRGVRVAR